MTDPITLATDHIGAYAVHINANDVAVLGARPMWFFAVMLFPEERTTPELADLIYDDVRTTCEELGITFDGGHTEITQGLERPILVGQMIGEFPQIVSCESIRQRRCLILLTRGVAIEGTAILARELSQPLRERIDAGVLARFLTEPGISVVRAALAACGTGDAVHVMHDSTEGGFASALFELVTPCGLGLSILRERIHIYAETEAICKTLAIDPLKLMLRVRC